VNKLEPKKKNNLSIDYDSLNSQIFNLIGYNKKVLDVGCSTGKLGEKLKNEKGCQVFGVELNSRAAEIAKKRLDDIIVANIEEIVELPFPKEFFDVIVFADVLEHTKNPDRILQKFKRYLSDNGYILLSIPNIANWMIRLDLLFGRFEYKDAGILDKTHLRFFTLKSAKELVTKSDFKIEFIGSYNLRLQLLGRLWKTMFAHQFIIKATLNR